MGAIQTGRRGIDLLPTKRCSTQDRKGRRDLVVKEKEEQDRFTKVVQQGVQGAWTSWEEVDQTISWKDLLSMSAGAIRYMISSKFDVLPSPLILKR